MATQRRMYRRAAPTGSSRRRAEENHTPMDQRLPAPAQAAPLQAGPLAHATACPVRLTAMRQIQREGGNHSVQRGLIQREGGATAEPPAKAANPARGHLRYLLPYRLMIVSPYS